MVVYLEDEDGSTRREAALCCCRLVPNSFSGAGNETFGSSRSNITGGGKRRHLVEEVCLKIKCLRSLLAVSQCQDHPPHTHALTRTHKHAHTQLSC